MPPLLRREIARSRVTPTEQFAAHHRLDRIAEGDELDLVRRAAEGDHDAFDQLVDEYATELYRLAVAVAGERDARDVTQDALVRAWREVPHLRDPERFGPWLRRILVNRARDVARAARRTVRTIPMAELGALEPSSADYRPVVERSAELRAAIRRLTLDQRTVVALHFVSGLTLSEVAAVLGIPAGTAKSRLSAALVALRVHLTDDTLR